MGLDEEIKAGGTWRDVVENCRKYGGKNWRQLARKHDMAGDGRTGQIGSSLEGNQGEIVRNAGDG